MGKYSVELSFYDESQANRVNKIISGALKTKNLPTQYYRTQGIMVGTFGLALPACSMAFLPFILCGNAVDEELLGFDESSKITACGISKGYSDSLIIEYEGSYEYDAIDDVVCVSQLVDTWGIADMESEDTGEDGDCKDDYDELGEK